MKVSKRLVAMLVIVVAAITAVGCEPNQANIGQPGAGQVQQSAQQGQASVQHIDAAQTKQLIDSDKTLQIIDVREPFEFQGGYIPGAKLIPVGEFIARMGEIDKTRPVLIYCATGSRSPQAAEVLVQSGYSPVYNFGPGLVQWPYPIVR